MDDTKGVRHARVCVRTPVQWYIDGRKPRVSQDGGGEGHEAGESIDLNLRSKKKDSLGIRLARS
jgi:hypothetical protein